MIQTGCVFVVVCPRLSFCPSNTTHFCGSFPKRRAASRKMSGLERLLQPRCLCLVITTCEGGWTIRHLEALTPTGNNKGELMKFNKLHQAGETKQFVSKFHAKHYWSNLNSAYILPTWSSLDNTTLIKKKQIMNQKEWSLPSKMTTIALLQNAHLRFGISSNDPRLVPSTRPPYPFKLSQICAPPMEEQTPTKPFHHCKTPVAQVFLVSLHLPWPPRPSNSKSPSKQWRIMDMYIGSGP